MAGTSLPPARRGAEQPSPFPRSFRPPDADPTDALEVGKRAPRSEGLRGAGRAPRASARAVFRRAPGEACLTPGPLREDREGGSMRPEPAYPVHSTRLQRPAPLPPGWLQGVDGTYKCDAGAALLSLYKDDGVQCGRWEWGVHGSGAWSTKA